MDTPVSRPDCPRMVGQVKVGEVIQTKALRFLCVVMPATHSFYCPGCTRKVEVGELVGNCVEKLFVCRDCLDI